IMSSHANKGKGVVVDDKGLMWLRKGTKGSKSSATKESPTRRFIAKVVEEYGLKWFNVQKEEKYNPKNWIDEGHLPLDFPTIRDTICMLGLDT
ncbi:hypothetical protein HAX54_034974, partial [Datura stramonium]|nr:hypothetical protein [Datura stramonium]